jgi:hypothetical protein
MREHLQPCTSQIVLIILVIACILFTSNQTFAQQFVFDEEVIAKWKAYEVFARTLQGTVHITGTLPNGKPRNSLYQYKQNRECACLSAEGSEASFDNWFICNSRYAAKIKRNKENSSEVVLLNYAQDKSAPIFGARVSVSDAAFVLSSPHFSFADSRLSEFALRAIPRMISKTFPTMSSVT